MGLIAVFAVAMLNGIVLMSFINELREKEASVTEAVRQGAELRLRPVLMTASIAVLGLLPMLLSSGIGAETQHPLVTVVGGGLITSTLLTLVLLPLIYEWIEARGAQRQAQREGGAASMPRPGSASPRSPVECARVDRNEASERRAQQLQVPASEDRLLAP